MNKAIALFLSLAIVTMLSFGAFFFRAEAQTQNSGLTLTQLVELFISLGIITPDKAASARQAVQGMTNAPEAEFTFTRNLKRGSVGEDVRLLQFMLNMNSATKVATSGAGSPGNETTFFGPLTLNAVLRFQNLYRSEILAPIGLTNATGFVGPMTRAKLNSLVPTGGPDTTPPPTTPPPVTPPNNTTAFLLSPGNQPAPLLAPEGAARIPFTRFTLTTTGTGTATLNSIIVQRVGLANNAVFESIVLLDENGRQIGNARTLNTNNQVMLNEPISISSGQVRTFTVAGNMTTNLDAYQGQLVGLSIVAVNANVPIAGSLPITGPLHTVNSNLAIGNATVAVGTTATSAITREIGTTALALSSLRITAGSNEDIRLLSIRWNQNGSASINDIQNVAAVIDNTIYPATVSSDGRFYTTTFGNGIVITKGLTKEITLRGDVVSGAGRTISFDIDRATDIHMIGETFGYGITASAPTTATANTATAEFTTGTPFFSAALTTIQGGFFTVSKASSVPAQNIGVQVANQTLGGFTFDIRGEAATVSNMIFDVTLATSSGSSASVEDIDNVTLVGSNGQVLAGPVNAVGTGTTGTITFTDAVTLPQGENTLILRGQLSTDFRQGDTITISLQPNADVTNIRGQTSDNVIAASPSSTITANTITVRDADVNISVSPTPSAQSVVAGAQDFTFARYQFDATASGEDIRFNTLNLQFTHSANPEALSDCYLLDGNNRLNTGSNSVNPSSGHVSGANLSWSLDNPLVIPRGTVKTIDLRCDISASATAGTTFSFGIASSQTAVGVQSGQTVTADISALVGQTITIAGTGNLSVTQDPSTPSYTIVTGGSTNVSMGVLNFRAGNEAVDLNQIGLELTSAAASSSPADITRVTLWDGNSQIGTAIFAGTSRFATSTLTQNFIIPANTDRDLIIRADLSEIGTSQAGTEGSLIQINYNGDDDLATKGVGMASGATITSDTTADTNFPGVRMMNTIPTIARVNTESSVLSSGERALLRFSVTADAKGDAGLYKFTVRFSTSTASVSNVNIFGFTNSGFSQVVAGVQQTGALDDTNKNPDSNGVVEIYSENSSGTSNALQVPAGQTRWFEVRGTVSGATSGAVVTTILEGDSAYPSLVTLMGTAAEIDADVNDDFIWSPNATTTSSASHRDWTNGFGVPGLPASGIQQTLSQ